MKLPLKHDYIAYVFIFAWIMALIYLSSCSIQYRASKIHTREMNEQLETYYHTAVWDKENSNRQEKKEAKKELKRYYNKVSCTIRE